MKNAGSRLAAAIQEGRVVAGLRRRCEALLDAPREHLYRRRLGLPHRRCDALPCFSMHGDFATLDVSALVRQAFDKAVASIGGPSDSVRAIEGMSGQKYRTFVNHLVRSHPDARYLEVGSWAGSTATAALDGNAAKVLCIDNWSQFGGPKEAFFANIEAVKSEKIDFRFIESDFRSVDYSSIGRFNVFLFDGPHEEADQYDGIMVARPALDETFVLIVDDWNGAKVRIGTFRALVDSGFAVHSAIEVRTTGDGTHPVVWGKSSDWHNGYFIAVVSAGR